MKKYKSKKGITLIELVITLGLMGFITALVFSFFISNQKTLDRVDIKSDLQYEAKEVMNKISKYAMEATSVNCDTPNKIIFSLVSSVGGIIEEGAIFKITGNEISLSGEGITESIICTKLKSITVGGDNKKNLEVEIVLEEKGIRYSIKDNFLFRNSHKK